MILTVRSKVNNLNLINVQVQRKNQIFNIWLIRKKKIRIKLVVLLSFFFFRFESGSYSLWLGPTQICFDTNLMPFANSFNFQVGSLFAIFFNDRKIDINVVFQFLFIFNGYKKKKLLSRFQMHNLLHGECNLLSIDTKINFWKQGFKYLHFFN